LVVSFVWLCLWAVPAVKAQDASTRAAIAVDRLMEWYNPLTARWNTTWWHSANALTSLVEFAARTDNTSFFGVYDETYLGNLVYWLEGYDDEAWLDAYSATNETKYLDLAKSIFKNMAEAWDDTCGGGIWWDRKRTYKNAITNELFLSIAGKLYMYTNDQTYLNYAVEEWKWFSASGMINSQNLINDGLSNCTNNHGTTWTYNQGVILGGLVYLSQMTNNSDLIVQAEKIANATLSLLVSSQHVLQEPCEPSNNCDGDQVQFKGIFMRNLAYLYTVTKSQYYAEFILANADSIWSSDRYENSLGLKWGGPFDEAETARHSSGLDALNAALVL